MHTPDDQSITLDFKEEPPRQMQLPGDQSEQAGGAGQSNPQDTQQHTQSEQQQSSSSQSSVAISSQSELGISSDQSSQLKQIVQASPPKIQIQSVQSETRIDQSQLGQLESKPSHLSTDQPVFGLSAELVSVLVIGRKE